MAVTGINTVTPVAVASGMLEGALSRWRSVLSEVSHMHADCESESGREGEGEAGRREGGKGVYGEEEDWVGKGKGSGESIHNLIDAVGTLFYFV